MPLLLLDLHRKSRDNNAIMFMQLLINTCFEKENPIFAKPNKYYQDEKIIEMDLWHPIGPLPFGRRYCRLCLGK